MSVVCHGDRFIDRNFICLSPSLRHQQRQRALGTVRSSLLVLVGECQTKTKTLNLLTCPDSLLSLTHYIVALGKSKYVRIPGTDTTNLLPTSFFFFFGHVRYTYRTHKKAAVTVGFSLVKGYNLLVSYYYY